MPKLQKRAFAPTTESTSNVASGLDRGGIRYESLPQDTQPPVPLNESYHQVVVSGALASRYSQHEELTSARASVSLNANTNFSRPPLVSPVSPLLDQTERMSRTSTQPVAEIYVPQPQGRSVDVGRLDGSTHATDRFQQANIAQDMHQGVNPPAYHHRGSDPNVQRPHKPLAPAGSDVAPGFSHRHSYNWQPRTSSRPGTTYDGCGRPKPARPPTSSHVSSSQPSQSATRSSGLLDQAQAYVAPPGAASSQGLYPPGTRTLAGPSHNSATTTQTPTPVASAEQQPRICQKCGKKKRPAAAVASQGTSPSSAPLQHPAQAGLRIAPPVDGAAPPQIDIIPPSGISYRPISLLSTATTFNDGSPLIPQQPVPKSQFSSTNIFRNNSLIRSLSRRLSGRAQPRESDGPLPSQQLRMSRQPDGSTPGNLINMISNAIKESGEENKDGANYQRLSVAADAADRPASPFSFMSVVREDEGYEMVEMGDDKEKPKIRDSDSTAVTSHASPRGKKADGSTSPSSSESLYGPEALVDAMDGGDVDRHSAKYAAERQQAAERRLAERRLAQRRDGGDLLAIPENDGNSRPQITRFQSLRKGVTRVASISRETSLKRLDSLKKLHTNWYRDDMAIEEIMSELQFAKQFLTTLDNKSTKYQPDHAFPISSAAELRIPASSGSKDSNSNSNNSSTKLNWQDQLSEPVFWDDLQTFLQDRLQDREGGMKLRAIIEKAWRADVVRIAT
ncbi:hypothetical protein DV738_g4531, partial [Chaetothyriales sp. CBS 135597]